MRKSEEGNTLPHKRLHPPQVLRLLQYRHLIRHRRQIPHLLQRLIQHRRQVPYLLQRRHLIQHRRLHLHLLRL